MSKRRLFPWLLAALLLCLPEAQTAIAFEYAGQAWCCDTIYYKINATNPAVACGGPVVGPWFQALVITAGNVWNAQGTQFRLVSSGTTSAGCTPSGSVCAGVKDGQNTISMATSCSWTDNNVIAYSTWWYWTQGDSARCIFESDICFNNNIRWFDNFQDCSGQCYDLVSLAVHEMGHWIACNHESHSIGYRPVMYPSYNYCEMRRTITADDSALLRWAYDPVGAISLPARANLVHYHPPYPSPPAHTPCQCDCTPGDANGDKTIDISDAVYLVAYIFGGGPAPTPYAICSGDANCDCAVDISDAVYLIAYIFAGGPAPCSCDQWLINCGPPLR